MFMGYLGHVMHFFMIDVCLCDIIFTFMLIDQLQCNNTVLNHLDDVHNAVGMTVHHHHLYLQLRQVFQKRHTHQLRSYSMWSRLFPRRRDYEEMIGYCSSTISFRHISTMVEGSEGPVRHPDFVQQGQKLKYLISHVTLRH